MPCPEIGLNDICSLYISIKDICRLQLKTFADCNILTFDDLKTKIFAEF